MEQQVVRLFVAVWACGAVTRDAAHDQARVALPQGVDTQPKPFHCARRQVLNEDVGRGEQPFEDRWRLLVLEVQRQRLLGAVQPDEVAGQAAHGRVVATRKVADLWPLDLDHARAKIGQLASRKRRRDCLLQGDDRDAFEWQHSSALPSLCLGLPDGPPPRMLPAIPRGRFRLEAVRLLAARTVSDLSTAL